MAKKRKPEKKKKSQKIVPIDCIPEYSQQPRSSPPKRRTDFSVFMCISPNSVVEVESVFRGGDFCSIRDASKEKGDTCVELESIPHRSPVSDIFCPSVTPGNVIWAKTASQIWWPAEIIKERSALSDEGSDGNVLVQFYGNHPCAWIDPMTDLSTFEDSFEERSSNPSTDLQDALKQALKKREQLSCRRKFSPDSSFHTDQQDHSSDKRTPRTSSRTRCHFPERGKGKREKKRKVHFDEVSLPLKSQKKCRRLKIMRYLGLTAPVGSPF